MDARIEAEVARGGGLVTAADLARRGVSGRQVARLVRAKRLVAVRRGVYTTADLWESWDDYRDRPLARVRAADRCIVVDHVSSHDSAALTHGLPLLRPQESAVHITRSDRRGTRVENGVEQHGARFDPDEVVVIDGRRILDVPRTVADISREHGYREGLVAADGAMQLGWSRQQLRRAARRMSGWPYSRRVDAVVDDADPGAESAAESLARELLDECGLWPAETQFPVRLDRGVAWIDLRVGRHLIEVSGRSKQVSIEDGGLRDRELEQLAWEERERNSEVCAQGFGMTPLVYADFWGSRRERAKRRLIRDHAVSTARFGTVLTPGMLAFAERMRGRRYKVAA